MEPLFFSKKRTFLFYLATNFLFFKKKKFLQGNFLVGSVGPLDKTSVIVSACPLWSVKSTSQVTLSIFKVFLQPGFWFFFLSDELFLGSSGICCVFHLLHYWGLHDEVSIFSATVWGRCHSDLLVYIFYNYLFFFLSVSFCSLLL